MGKTRVTVEKDYYSLYAAAAARCDELQRDNEKLVMRLDACLYAMVLMQNTIRQMRDSDKLALAT